MKDDNPVDKENEVYERLDILKLLDDFIENVMRIKKTLIGLSLSALVLAPFAVFLSLYLIFNPSFFAILAIETEFGLLAVDAGCGHNNFLYLDDYRVKALQIYIEME